jgi:tRNA-2-methylthio-N6-dimethylallyladenosine synthase
MKLFVKTFGCQMNVHDSSRIAEIMAGVGYETTGQVKEADLIVINTCSIRDKAQHKGISEIGRLCKKVKQKRPETVVAVAGCVSEQVGEKIFETAPLVDLVVGPDRYPQLPDLVSQARGDTGRLVSTGFDQGLSTDFLPTTSGQGDRPVSEFVTIAKGCDERCNYCIVPSVRGPERFRRPREVTSEVTILVDEGVREVTLLGQKVNAYESGGTSFAELLGRLDDIEGLARLRFTSPHPRHMSDELIAAFGQLRTLCEYIHLPVQSGSDRVLKKMGRRYTIGLYKEIVAKLRESCPQILISTDIIVGFPGETETDFQETLDLLEAIRFSGAFSFKFSPRPGTPAASLPDEIPQEEKVRRLAAAHEIIDRIEGETRLNMVGKTFEVLVAGHGRNPGQLTGRARNHQIINFLPEKGVKISATRGRLVNVEVTKALPHSLEGVPADKEVSWTKLESK